MRLVPFIAAVMAALIVSLPICLATELGMTYDSNGNLVTGDGKYRVYNGLNQLSAIYNGTNSSGVLLESYDYHPTEERILGKRVYNSTGAVIETTIYFSKTFVKVINTTGTYDFTYVYQNGQLVAIRNPDGTKIFIHGDNKGSSQVVTNSTGQAIENSSYDPYGNTLTGNTKTRYGYEAKESDTVVGDTDFHARKYCTQPGIFCQPDTRTTSVYDPQSLNKYSFERNNPYDRIDPTGHIAPLVIAFVAIATVIAVVNIVLKDFERKNPSCATTPSITSKKVSPSTTPANDVASGIVKVTAPEVLKVVNSATSKTSAEMLSKTIGTEITQGAVKTAGEFTGILLAIGIAIKDTDESLGILKKYPDKQFDTQFPEYLNQRLSGKSGILNTQCSDNADPAKVAPTTVVMDDNNNIEVNYIN